MKLRWAWTLPVLSILAWSAPEAAFGQGPMGYPGGMPMTSHVQGYIPVMPAGYMGPGGQPGLLPNAYGAYGSAPDGMPMGGGGPGMGAMMGGQDMSGGSSMGPDLTYGGGMGGGMGGCQNCGGMGCGACGGGLGHGSLLGDVFGCIAPYPDGGCAAVR